MTITTREFVSSLVALPLLAALSLTSACSDDGGGAGGAGGEAAEPDPAADACEHLQGGPFVDVSATSDASQAPDVSAEHTTHRVALEDDTMGGWIGYVSYAVAEAGEYVFFTDDDVTMSLEDGSGAAVDWEQECTSDCTDACGEVAQSRTVDISSVGTYGVRIESQTDGEVSLVVVHAGEHEHE